MHLRPSILYERTTDQLAEICPSKRGTLLNLLNYSFISLSTILEMADVETPVWRATSANESP